MAAIAARQEEIPIEMIEEILKYVPNKSLLRFTTLSRPINSLINTRRFIKRHLSLSVSTNNDLSLILSYVHSNEFILSCDYYDTSLRQILKHPFENTQDDIIGSGLIGSSYGLICMVNWGYFDAEICILNPTTRKHRVLPRNGIYLMDSFNGFGLHWQVNEIEHYVAQVAAMEVVAIDRVTTNMVAAFDLDMKNGSIIPLPDVVESTPRKGMHLSKLGECLSIIIEQLDGNGIEAANVWVMKEYGVKESWEKLFSFSTQGIPSSKFHKKETRVVEHLPIRLGATIVDVSPDYQHTVGVGSIVSP
ncbi:hypothetical protein ACFE04_023020 [Oxalis oulophora]